MVDKTKPYSNEPFYIGEIFFYQSHKQGYRYGLIKKVSKYQESYECCKSDKELISRLQRLKNIGTDKRCMVYFLDRIKYSKATKLKYKNIVKRRLGDKKIEK